MTKKQDKKYLFQICELLSTIGLLGNTIILIIFRNAWTYEEVSFLNFSPTPKSSYLTIIQHNPIFAIMYAFYGMVLLLCEVYRLIKHIVKRKGKGLMKVISVSAIGNLISAHMEGDNEKFLIFANFIADAYEEAGEVRCARIIRKRIDGTYKNDSTVTLD